MELCIQVISSHPLVELTIRDILSRDQAFRTRFSSEPCVDPRKVPHHGGPFLFILDSCSLCLELAAIRRLLYMRYPESKFLVLLSPEKGTDEEMLRLLYVGIDGFSIFADQLAQELPRALRAIMSGNLWVPHLVLHQYVRQTNLLLDTQLRPEPRLTARENQIFQLVVRRLSNKEIGGALEIAERTVKFHISNIFSKLKVQGRRELLTTISLVGFPQTFRP